MKYSINNGSIYIFVYSYMPKANQHVSHINLDETERLKKDIYRPDMEKFRLFTLMLRRNALLKKAIIRHK